VPADFFAALGTVTGLLSHGPAVLGLTTVLLS